jgi:hypothetical protein
VKGIEITILPNNNEDHISLTDMLKAKGDVNYLHNQTAFKKQVI